MSSPSQQGCTGSDFWLCWGCLSDRSIPNIHQYSACVHGIFFQPLLVHVCSLLLGSDAAHHPALYLSTCIFNVRGWVGAHTGSICSITSLPSVGRGKDIDARRQSSGSPDFFLFLACRMYIVNSAGRCLPITVTTQLNKLRIVV